MATKGIKGFDIKGLKEVYKNLELAEEEIIAAALKGQKVLAQNILGESQKLVPVLSGTLKRSGHVKTEGNITTISYNTPYALRIHEGGDIKVKGYSVKEHDVKGYTITNFMGKGKSVTIKAHKRKAHSVKGYEIKGLVGAKYLERPFNEKVQDYENYISTEVYKAMRKKYPS